MKSDPVAWGIRGVVAGLAASLVSCAHQLPAALVGDVGSLAECAANSTSTVALSVSSLPIAIPSDLAAKGPNATTGVVARRITVMFAPEGVRTVGAVAWSRATLRIYGGTFDGWTRVRSDDVSVEVARSVAESPSRKAIGGDEMAIGSATPGALTLTRSATSRKPLSNAITVDVLILPGGVPVDEPLVRIPALWSGDGKPLAPDDVRVQLEPTRHVPGYDLIDSEVVLDYVSVPVGLPSASARRAEGSACRGVARTRAVLVDKDGVRPPLWDLGLSSKANLPRAQWLALRDSASGAFRAVFDSPAAATSFANWIRATQATRVGGYQIGLFDRAGRKALRPLVPVDVGLVEQFRVITGNEAADLRVGALGEP